MNEGFAKTYNAGGAITARRLVKFDVAGDVVQASAAADLLIGVSDWSGDVVSGQRVDIHMGEQPEVEAGAAIAAGARLTSDANGKAVTAAAGEQCVGFATEAAAADGDVITFHYAPHKA